MATRDGYKTMMVALQNYAHSIQDCEKKLVTAANVCCEEMDNDKISTESKQELLVCLAELNKVVPQIEELFQKIYAEYTEAFNI